MPRQGKQSESVDVYWPESGAFALETALQRCRPSLSYTYVSYILKKRCNMDVHQLVSENLQTAALRCGHGWQTACQFAAPTSHLHAVVVKRATAQVATNKATNIQQTDELLMLLLPCPFLG